MEVWFGIFWLLIFWLLIFSIIPAFLWGYFFWKKDFLDPQPVKMVFFSFLAGASAAGVLVYEKNFFLELVSSWQGDGLIMLFFSVGEEFLKILFLFFCGKFLHLRFTQVIDGAVYGAIAGIGFAAVENFVYFWSLSMGGEIFFTAEFFQVFMVRSIGSILVHTLSTGIFGLFWGYAIFSKRIAPFDTTPMVSFGQSVLKNFFQNISFRVLRHHIIPKKIPDHGHQKIEIIKEGFLIAIIIHFVSNFFFGISGFGNIFLMVFGLMLLGVFIFFSHQFVQEKNIKIYDPL